MPQFQLVRVVNKGKKDITDFYNSERFIIRAGKAEGTFVPYDAAIIWFGNPQAVDNPRYPARNMEIERIQMRYGGYGDAAAWEANHPRVEVYTTDGERIYTIIDDPEGSHIQPIGTELSPEDARTAEMAQMQRAISELQAALAATSQSGSEPVTLPSDDPQTVPVGPPSPALPDGSAAGVMLTIQHDNDLPEDAPQ